MGRSAPEEPAGQDRLVLDVDLGQRGGCVGQVGDVDESDGGADNALDRWAQAVQHREDTRPNGTL